MQSRHEGQPARIAGLAEVEFSEMAPNYSHRVGGICRYGHRDACMSDVCLVRHRNAQPRSRPSTWGFYAIFHGHRELALTQSTCRELQRWIRDGGQHALAQRPRLRTDVEPKPHHPAQACAESTIPLYEGCYSSYERSEPSRKRGLWRLCGTSSGLHPADTTYGYVYRMYRGRYDASMMPEGKFTSGSDAFSIGPELAPLAASRSTCLSLRLCRPRSVTAQV